MATNLSLPHYLLKCVLISQVPGGKLIKLSAHQFAAKPSPGNTSMNICHNQYKMFIRVILDFSFFLGWTIFTIMISVGVYFVCKYCCLKRCRKR